MELQSASRAGSDESSKCRNELRFNTESECAFLVSPFFTASSLTQFEEKPVRPLKESDQHTC
jgi:hypothetical protein